MVIKLNCYTDIAVWMSYEYVKMNTLSYPIKCIYVGA